MSKKYKLFNKQSLYSILVGFLIKNGNKSSAIKIINTAFSKVSRIKLPLSRRQILLKLFLKLNSFVEVRKLKVRKRSIFCAVSYNFKKTIIFNIKMVSYAHLKKNKRKISISEKLAYEIEQTLTTDASLSLELLKSNLDLANYKIVQIYIIVGKKSFMSKRK